MRVSVVFLDLKKYFKVLDVLCGVVVIVVVLFYVLEIYLGGDYI